MHFVPEPVYISNTNSVVSFCARWTLEPLVLAAEVFEATAAPQVVQFSALLEHAHLVVLQTSHGQEF